MPAVAPGEEKFHDLLNYSQENALEEAEMPPEVSNSMKLKAPVPTSEEIAKGSIWGNIVFDAHIDRVVSVKKQTIGDKPSRDKPLDFIREEGLRRVSTPERPRMEDLDE